MDRMRKDNEESLRRIHGSSEALSVRIENIKKRREDKSSNSSHGEDEAYEEDVGGRRNGKWSLKLRIFKFNLTVDNQLKSTSCYFKE